MHGQRFSAKESGLKGDFVLKPHQLYLIRQMELEIKAGLKQLV